VNEAKRYGVRVGVGCRFIGTTPSSFSTEPFLIKIGNHVSMTRPRFITHDGSVWVYRDRFPDIELFGTITIGNNCFIGEGVIILPNTTIGDNCIIGAGSIVKGTFPSDSVIAGCPSRVISSINEYFSKNRQKFTYFRSLPKELKREKLNELFNK
jgi:acetyltransferase-like isoleucine patch superfamily enzyme